MQVWQTKLPPSSAACCRNRTPIDSLDTQPQTGPVDLLRFWLLACPSAAKRAARPFLQQNKRNSSWAPGLWGVTATLVFSSSFYCLLLIEMTNSKTWDWCFHTRFVKPPAVGGGKCQLSMNELERMDVHVCHSECVCRSRVNSTFCIASVIKVEGSWKENKDLYQGGALQQASLSMCVFVCSYLGSSHNPGRQSQPQT